MRLNRWNIFNFVFVLLILSFTNIVVNGNQLCNYYPSYPNSTQYQVVGCRETCCPNYPIKPSDACCRFKDFNFDAESVALIVITVIAFLVFNIIVFTIVIKLFLSWKRKRGSNSNNTINIPNAHVISQQQTSNSYPMADLASPPSYQNIAPVPSSQISYDKQSIETDYLPKYDYLTSSNDINNNNSTVDATNIATNSNTK